MIPEAVKKFLEDNPSFSLSFLPFEDNSIVFFLQDKKEYLENYTGKLPVEVCFYKEKNNKLIMRLSFYYKKTIQVEKDNDIKTSKTSEGKSYYETEFHLNKEAHLEVLELLKETEEYINLMLYDRFTGFHYFKRIGFNNQLLQKLI